MVSTVSIPFRDDLLQKVDDFARDEATSREGFINKAIENYVNLKEFDSICAAFREGFARTGFTEDDLNEEIRLCREEEKARRSK